MLTVNEPVIREYNEFMKTRRRLYLIAFGTLCWLQTVSALAAGGNAPGDYAGQWVMKLGQRNFMVLTLRMEDGKLAGTLREPSDFRISNELFSQIDPRTESLVVVRSSVQPGYLHFVVQDPSDKTGENEFDMALTDADEALLTLKLPGIALDPWRFIRVHGTGEPAVATDWDPQRSYWLDDSGVPSAEMKKIFDEDQKVRQHGISPEEWPAIGKKDAERREATHKLLAAGQLHTGQDFEEAAFVLQHGTTADDFLLAHSLALIALARGNAKALWIATATLDRYLQSAGKPQVYGTQFPTMINGKSTQEPYNRGLISDALRKSLGVPSQAAQEEQLRTLNGPAKVAPR